MVRRPLFWDCFLCYQELLGFIIQLNRGKDRKLDYGVCRKEEYPGGGDSRKKDAPNTSNRPKFSCLNHEAAKES